MATLHAPQQQTKKPQHTKSVVNTHSMQECIQNCLECFQSCTALTAHCLGMGGEHAGKEHITLLQTCAAICETSVKFMSLDSEFHHETCRVCAMVCEKCAEDCERIGANDETMLECAEVCRRCAKSCEKMSQQH